LDSYTQSNSIYAYSVSVCHAEALMLVINVVFSFSFFKL